MRDRRSLGTAPRPCWTGRDFAFLALIVSVGGLLRAWHLNVPQRSVFDESWYARDGCWYHLVSKSACGLENFVASDRDTGRWLRAYSELTPEHPPLGKWLIGSGIHLFGYGPGGSRVASLIAGTLTIAVVYLLARELTGSTLGAMATAGLLAGDFLHIVQSRVAMLEVFVGFFASTAFLFCLYDRHRDRTAVAPSMPLLDRRFRAAAGIASGAAAAVKLSGWLVVIGALVLVFGSEWSDRRGHGPALLRTLKEEGRSILFCLLFLPALVLALSYGGRLEGALLSLPWSQNSFVSELIARQGYIVGFHSSPLRDAFAVLSVPMLQRPIPYFLDTSGGVHKEMLAWGNPLVWWPSLAEFYVGATWLRKRLFTAPEGLIVIGFMATYAPWLLLAQARQNVFVFYFTPALPFACLALGCLVAASARRRLATIPLRAFALACLVALVLYYPLLVAGPVSPSRAKRLTQWIRPSPFPAHDVGKARLPE